MPSVRLSYCKWFGEQNSRRFRTPGRSKASYLLTTRWCKKSQSCWTDHFQKLAESRLGTDQEWEEKIRAMVEDKTKSWNCLKHLSNTPTMTCLDLPSTHFRIWVSKLGFLVRLLRKGDVGGSAVLSLCDDFGESCQRVQRAWGCVWDQPHWSDPLLLYSCTSLQWVVTWICTLN